MASIFEEYWRNKRASQPSRTRSGRVYSKPYVSKKVKKGKTVKKAVVEIVRRAVTSQAEKKTVSYRQALNFGSFTGYGVAEINCSLGAPNLPMSQGTSQGQRVGNKIRIVNATISIIMTPYGYNSTNSLPTPYDIRFAFISNKATPQAVPAVTNCWQNGGATYGLDGSLNDQIAKWNTDVIRHYGRDVFSKLGNATQGQGGTSAGSYQSNNDYKMNVKRVFNITKYLPKVITYNDGTTTPINPFLYMRMVVSGADGNNYANAVAIGSNYEISITYTDM